MIAITICNAKNLSFLWRIQSIRSIEPVNIIDQSFRLKVDAFTPFHSLNIKKNTLSTPFALYLFDL